MSAPVRPCLGGWCQRRDKCAHYADPTARHNPAERLCDRGSEDRMFFLPLNPKHDEATPA